MMFRRQLVKVSLKGLRLLDASVIEWQGQKALEVHAIGERVKARRVFVPERAWKISPLLASWQRSNLRDMGRCNCWDFRREGNCKHLESRKPKTKHERAIEKLEREMPREYRPENPAVVVGSTADEGYRHQWSLWHSQKAMRRKVMKLALRTGWKHSHRSRIEADLSSARLYAELSKLGFDFKKWGDITGSYREYHKLNTIWDYIGRLWEFCGLGSQPNRYEWDDEPEWGSKRYQSWLEDLHERKAIQEQIAAIRAEMQHDSH